ncbi:MAG TPA: MFS transporter [Rhodothermales bacterium]
MTATDSHANIDTPDRTRSSKPVGYLDLIRSNRNFRLLWTGDVVSFFGDWFNTIALYAIVERLTGSPFALGLVFITKMLPMGLASPIAGLIADRFNRRRLMIGADIARAAIVLGFLFVNTAEDLPLLYLLAALQVVIGAVFLPARGASIPNITSESELVTANALMASTWSAILALGAALGGFATSLFGEDAVFVLDSLSYLVSAGLLWFAVIPQTTERGDTSRSLVKQAYEDVLAGWRYMRDYPRVGRIALAKAAWALSGGGLVFMLTLLGSEVMPAAPAVAIGILFSARGVGTGIGPILARRWFRDEDFWPALLGFCICFSGAFYIVVGVSPWTSILFLATLVTVAHSSSGANWVVSNVMLQKRAIDRFRGRVFATEWLTVTLVDTASILTVSLLLQWAGVGLRAGFLVFAGLQVVTGIVWLVVVVPREATESRT